MLVEAPESGNPAVGGVGSVASHHDSRRKRPVRFPPESAGSATGTARCRRNRRVAVRLRTRCTFVQGSCMAGTVFEPPDIDLVLNVTYCWGCSQKIPYLQSSCSDGTIFRTSRMVEYHLHHAQSQSTASASRSGRARHCALPLSSTFSRSSPSHTAHKMWKT
jgi:hypothetical protein